MFGVGELGDRVAGLEEHFGEQGPEIAVVLEQQDLPYAFVRFNPFIGRFRLNGLLRGVWQIDLEHGPRNRGGYRP